MDIEFSADEKLYRAVRPLDIFWKPDGTVSSAAFHDKNGLSVDRGAKRRDIEVVEAMRRNGLQGGIISVTVQDCNNAGALVLYKPIDSNQYHSEIHRNKTEAGLTKGQMRKLSKQAVIVVK